MINEIELTQAKWSIKAAVRMAENEKELIEIGGYICRTMAERESIKEKRRNTEDRSIKLCNQDYMIELERKLKREIKDGTKTSIS